MGLACSPITLDTLIYHRLTMFSGNSKPAGRKAMGFNSPSRHHLKYQYPLWIQSLAALARALNGRLWVIVR